MSAILEPLHSIRRLIGVDKAVYYSVVSKVLSTIGSLITVPLILTHLTLIEQGFYYTFNSILALQVILEMGFGAVAIQMVAHEAAHLKINMNIGVSGPIKNVERFYTAIKFIKNWYLVLSVLVAIFLFPVGYWFFSTSSGIKTINWHIPWIIMVISTSGGVLVNSMGSIIEGMGLVSESIRIRLWGGSVQIVLSILGLLFGFRLYAVPLANFVALIINFILIWNLSRNIIKDAENNQNITRINWFKDVFPFQWRIAISWISGWFIFNAMLPVIFRQLGPSEAGRFGMAMSITSFISIFASNWTSTKSAIWGQMVSRKEWASMDSLFLKVMPQSVTIAVLASIFAILIVPHISDWFPHFSGRVPEWNVLMMLCSVAVMNQVVFAEAFYLRAHKREPFLANSIFCGLAMAIGLFCFSHSSAFSISILYAILTLVSGVIWGSIIFLNCRLRWHKP